ncbi:S1C family serine protease [Marispirochaeta aestuarii]|uniref:S1C family serine protease n=1 Tax=Marispirochaeta aestuarii TaxID=1963862 RepID=UPI002ABD30C7|nr:S1C family serine protease [Marispirochaeta aestuarii]
MLIIQRCKFVSILIILLILVSCASGPVLPEIPDVREINLQELQRLMDSREPLRALETVDILHKRGLIGRDEHSTYRKEIDQMISEEFHKAVEASDFTAALRLSRAAELLELSLEEGPDRKDLYLDMLHGLVEKEMLIPAFAQAAEALSSGLVRYDDLGFLTEAARNSGYQEWSEYLEAEPDDPEEKITGDLPGIIDSTVTIWVNRGIRIEGGMGYPDRVIGSGFFVDKNGYLITNYHVIASEVDPEYEGYSRLFIRRGDSRSPRIPARVVGWDPILDLALLKAEITPGYIFSPGKRTPRLGETIYAIGSPGGLEKTITSGIVSATERRLLQLGEAMQIDVPINQGNSGGPLMNEQGRLVGIVFAGIEFFEGINFAVPVYWLQAILSEMYAGGEVRHSWIGSALHEGADGLTNLYTVPGSPADNARIREGYRLVSVNGQAVGSLREVNAILVRERPGNLLKTLWEQQGGTGETVYMVLAERPQSPVLEAHRMGAEKELVLPLFGMKIQETGAALWEKSYVVEKVYPGTIADETGLSPNDPFYWRGLRIDPENKLALLRMVIKKRKAGFLESSIQLASYIDVDYFI